MKCLATQRHSETSTIEIHGVSYEVPNSFICPITLQIMERPLLSRTGHNFERSAILNWLERNDTCPLSRKPLRPNQLIPNKSLQECISVWKELNDYTFNGILEGDNPVCGNHIYSYDDDCSMRDSLVFFVPFEEIDAVLERAEMHRPNSLSRGHECEGYDNENDSRAGHDNHQNRVDASMGHHSTKRSKKASFLKRVFASALRTN